MKRKTESKSQKILRTVVGNSERLRLAMRGTRGARYELAKDGKTATHKTKESGRVVYCATCKAPVKDSDAARRGHAARLGCAVV